MGDKTTAGFSIKKIFGRSEITVIVAVLILGVIFTIFSDSFLTSYNLFNMGRTAAIYIFIAIAQGLVVIVGGMNLSLGYIGGMVVVAAGYSMEILGLSSAAAVLIGLLVGILAGAVNGLVITGLKLNSFVVTLATSFIFQGLINGVSQGFPYNEIPEGFTFLGREGFLGIPYLLWLAGIALAVLGYVFRYTVTGRRVLATGGNATSAKYSGVRVNKITVLAFIYNGCLAAIAGTLYAGRAHSARWDFGSGVEMNVIAAVVLGGTAMSGGTGSAIGALIGSFLIMMIDNGLVIGGLGVAQQTFMRGIIIILAVALSEIGRMKKRA